MKPPIPEIAAGASGRSIRFAFNLTTVASSAMAGSAGRYVLVVSKIVRNAVHFTFLLVSVFTCRSPCHFVNVTNSTGNSFTGPSRPDSLGSQPDASKRPSGPLFSLLLGGKLTL
jgi:hypothetical protein